MKSKPVSKIHTHFSVQLISLLTAGLIVSIGSVVATNYIYRQSLIMRANTIAASLNVNDVTTLTRPYDLNFTGTYTNLQKKLQNIKSVNSDARIIYLLANDQQFGIYFLANSEKDSSANYSPNGQQYPTTSRAISRLFLTGKSVVEGPVSGHGGRWLSAMAPIKDPAGGRRPVGVVGIDIPGSTYLSLLALAGGLPILVTLLAIVVAYGRYRARRHQEEALQFRSELMSIASHEMRSPLAGLRWSEELVMSSQLEAPARKAMEIMHDSTLRLEESIEDVLQLAALESGKIQQLDIHETDLKAIITNIFSIQQLNASQHDMVLEFAPSWPETLLILCDARRMKRVFHNIVSNAIKYGKPNTSVTVGYTLTNACHIISITDHGIGIPANEQSKVFGGFYRATNARNVSISGTGMGLYLSRTILKQHGGTINLSSTPEQGTTVTVLLPISATVL